MVRARRARGCRSVAYWFLQRYCVTGFSAGAIKA
jgi:hypothetical protein